MRANAAAFLLIPSIVWMTWVGYLIRRIEFPTEIGGREAAPE